MFSQTITDSKHIIHQDFSSMWLRKAVLHYCTVFLPDNLLINCISDTLFILFISDLTRFVKGKSKQAVFLKKQVFIEILSNVRPHLTSHVTLISCLISAHL